MGLDTPRVKVMSRPVCESESGDGSFRTPTPSTMGAFPMFPSGANLLTVGLLVILEAMLSADNALVLAVIVLGLPRALQKKALRQGLAGAFTSRIVATLLAVQLIRVLWVKLAGGIYLLYLAYAHFFSHGEAGERRRAKRAEPMFGLSAYWATVVR